MSNYIYKSSGSPKGLLIIRIFIGLFLVFFGAIILASSTTKSSPVLGQLIRSNNKQFFLILGIVAFIGGIIEIINCITINKSSLTVYSDHIEGVAASLSIPTTKPFNFSYSNIESISLDKRGVNAMITIFSCGTKFSVLINGDASNAYNAIMKAKNNM